VKQPNGCYDRSFEAVGALQVCGQCNKIETPTSAIVLSEIQNQLCTIPIVSFHPSQSRIALFNLLAPPFYFSIIGRSRKAFPDS
jgi:hypothetical protein